MATAVQFDTTCGGMLKTPASWCTPHRLEGCPKAVVNAAEIPLGRTIQSWGKSRTRQFSAILWTGPIKQSQTMVGTNLRLGNAGHFLASTRLRGCDGAP